jgi:hypothetical protein
MVRKRKPAKSRDTRTARNSTPPEDEAVLTHDGNTPTGDVFTPTDPVPPEERPTRSFRRLAWGPGYPPTFVVVQINEGIDTAQYLVQDLGSEVFQVTKLLRGRNRVYAVTMAGQHSRCPCEGFRHRGECRHIALVAALKGAGKL